MAKLISNTGWLFIFFLCACEAPTAPPVDQEGEVFFAHGEAPEAPKKLTATIVETSIADLSWKIVSPYTEQIRIKKQQYLTDANNHPCDLQLTEIYYLEGRPTTFRDSLDLELGNFVRYTFSTVFNDVVSIKKNEIEVIFPK